MYPVDNKLITMNTVQAPIYNYVTSLDNWNMVATIRPHFKLSTKYSFSLMDRLFKNRYINKVFWCKESDKNFGWSHLHLLLDTDFNHSKMKYNMELLNKAMGYKKDSMLVGHFDKVRNVEKYTNYMCKHISRDSAYGILA